MLYQCGLRYPVIPSTAYWSNTGRSSPEVPAGGMWRQFDGQKVEDVRRSKSTRSTKVSWNSQKLGIRSGEAGCVPLGLPLLLREVQMSRNVDNSRMSQTWHTAVDLLPPSTFLKSTSYRCIVGRPNDIRPFYIDKWITPFIIIQSCIHNSVGVSFWFNINTIYTSGLRFLRSMAWSHQVLYGFWCRTRLCTLAFCSATDFHPIEWQL